MRIKIIGENNCARATRHLLRLAGFAVTEFLPAEVVTQAPHLGFAITIETASWAAHPSSGQASTAQTSSLRAAHPSSGQASTAHTRLAPAPLPLPAFAPNTGATAGLPSLQPDSSTLGQAAVHEGASLFVGGASSPASFLGSEDVQVDAGGPDGRLDETGGPILAGDEKSKQTEVCFTGRIHFDSVDGELEAAILRHVTQIAAAPVVVDRPGGVVHSERELRIVLPVTGDARADEAAAVAVEFGVLRGLLDLTRGPSRGELGAGAGGDSDAGGKSGEGRGGRWNKWWIFGAALVVVGLAVFGAALDAASRVGGGVVGKGAQTEVYATGGGPVLAAQPEMVLRARFVRGAALRSAARFSAAEPQGQFATGQSSAGALLEPCQVQTKLFVSINQTASTQLVAGTSSKKIYVCSIHVVVAAATSVALVEGTGSVCGTGTAGVSGFGGATAATGWNFMANGGIALGSGAAAVGAEGTSADNLCLFNSGSGQVSGGISYVVQ